MREGVSQTALLSALMVTSHVQGINWGQRQGHQAHFSIAGSIAGRVVQPGWVFLSRRRLDVLPVV
jgi:hypothetical protein